jgi:nucleoside diphosphate kinase
MTTLADLVNEIERQLLHHYTAPQLDNPSATFTTAATTIVLSTVNSIAPGSVIDCGFELMYVTNWVEGSRTATVIRGLYGSTARQGATTDLVRINPRISSVAMIDAIRDEIRSWDERLFAVETDAVTFGGEDGGVEANPTRDPYRVLSARPRVSASTDDYRWIVPELRRSEPTAAFASGYSLHLPPGMRFGESTVVDVTYAMPFVITTMATTTDLESTIGLSTTMLEIIKWGVLARIMAGKQEARADAFGTIRTDLEQSVPALTPLQVSSQYKRMRDMAYDTEVRRLLNRYPYRTAG